MTSAAERADLLALLRVPATRKLSAWNLICLLPFARTLCAAGRVRDWSAALIEIAVVEGHCLRPWLVTGDVLLYHRTLEPLHGDVVMTETSFHMRAGLGTPARKVAAIGGAKQLRIDGGRRMATSADGSYWLDDPDGGHDIAGIVVGVLRRPGWPWRRRARLAQMTYGNIAA